MAPTRVKEGTLHTHVHQTPKYWPQVLHHYYRIALVDNDGADARESVLLTCHQVEWGGERLTACYQS